jgi:hypothetical protein
MAITPNWSNTMDWTYYTMRNDGFLYDDDGNRETFDGKPRFAASEWESFLEENDIRGTVR